MPAEWHFNGGIILLIVEIRNSVYKVLSDLMEDNSSDLGQSKARNQSTDNQIQDTKEPGIGDPGIEWSDENDLDAGNGQLLNEKADKYIKEIADIEDLPDEEDVQQADEVIKDED